MKCFLLHDSLTFLLIPDLLMTKLVLKCDFSPSSYELKTVFKGREEWRRPPVSLHGPPSGQPPSPSAPDPASETETAEPEMSPDGSHMESGKRRIPPLSLHTEDTKTVGAQTETLGRLGNHSWRRSRRPQTGKRRELNSSLLNGTLSAASQECMKSF